MALHAKSTTTETELLAGDALFLLDTDQDKVPRLRLPAQPMPAEAAYRLIHEELALDGNARLNLATFVTTWMEPQATALMAECAEKNMIDKDEYPQTAELERRCVAILADLWNAPDPQTAVGCSTTCPGSRTKSSRRRAPSRCS